jgi:Tetratricopeptide repeat
VTIPRQEPTGRPVSLPPRPAVLFGREGLLDELQARLADGDRSGPRIVALHGLGGAGKTSVAVEYAHRQQAAAGLVWQFPADEPVAVEAEFARLAAILGVGAGLLDPRDPVAAVHAALAGSADPWLLVFDNVPHAAAVRRFLPPAGDGQVLITSQSSAWPTGQGIEVPVLDAAAAAEFLTIRAAVPEAEGTAAELAAELGGLPLALEQAAAYIRETGLTVAGYLSLFRRRRADLLARGEPQGYDKTVATTWAVAFSRLGADAAGLLRLLACLAPEVVPLNLLFGSAVGDDGLEGEAAWVVERLARDPIARGDAVKALRQFSLVTPAGDGQVLVHRLVQAVTLAQMTPEVAGQWRLAAGRLVEAAVPADTYPLTTWPTCAILLPHAQAVLPPTSDATWRLAQYLGYSGSYAAARDLWRDIAAYHDILGAENPDTLAAQAMLAYWTGEAGDAVLGRDMYVELLPSFERVFGPEHPRTLAVRHDLAYSTGLAGDAAAARDLYAELLPVRERVLTSENPSTLDTRHELARWTGEAGDSATARDLYAELLPSFESVLGPEHPGTLTVRHELARWTGAAGSPATARDLYAELLPVTTRVLGPEHPRTLIASSNLAYWTGEAGDAAGARDMFADLLPVTERVFGKEHPETLRTRRELAYYTGEAGDAAGARDMFADLLPVTERVFGPEHPLTLGIRLELARWTGAAGNAAAARDMFADLLPITERISGPEYPDTLTVRHELARWTGAAGNAAAARDMFADLLPITERIFGPEHPRNLNARANLALWTGAAGDAGSARDLLTELLPSFERAFGPEHQQTLGIRLELARWTGAAGNASAARDLYAKVLSLSQHALGPEHIHTTNARAGLEWWTGQVNRPTG